jgi:hypothetical protein
MARVQPGSGARKREAREMDWEALRKLGDSRELATAFPGSQDQATGCPWKLPPLSSSDPREQNGIVGHELISAAHVAGMR